MPSEKEKMLAGELYLASDPELVADRIMAARRQKALNSTDPRCDTTPEEHLALLRECFASVGDGSYVQTPVYFDYGKNTTLGDRVYMNTNCVILDVAPVSIGSGTMMASGVQILTATHPLDAATRVEKALEMGRPIDIGQNVWIGAGALVLPGVTIGDNSVVAAGSVVTRDVPANSVVKGNPARVHRPVPAAQIIASARTSGRLNLANQHLRQLPEAVFVRDETSATSNWWEDVDLTRLVVADNELQELDPRLSDLCALTLIDAHNNRLLSLPNLTALTQLSVLNVSNNALNALPDSLASLPLVELHLANNQLTEIPDSFVLLASTLSVLDLSSNVITFLPQFILNSFTRLKKFSCRNNKISSHLEFGSLPSLSNFDASTNKIPSLRFTKNSNLISLCDLNASINCLQSVFVCEDPGVTTIFLPTLALLDVRMNRVATLLCAEGRVRIETPALKDLGLQGNLLQTVSGSGILESCVKIIETLDVRDNALDCIPQEVIEMGMLKRLLLEGNPIRVPRRAILDKGTMAIIAWMKDRVVE
ncbi:hypothetical protein HDU84_005035 [Entophlyctis sp. JEL0112]|nr:hypothetical protein HDU84_005035 [Entophlyctis sp. JEL0112]